MYYYNYHHYLLEFCTIDPSLVGLGAFLLPFGDFGAADSGFFLFEGLLLFLPPLAAFGSSAVAAAGVSSVLYAAPSLLTYLLQL